MVTLLDQLPPQHSNITDITPLVGSRGVPIRHYHSNENVRIIAQQTMATPHFLHIPALAQTRHELELLTQTELYQSVLTEWGQLDVALVNVGNHPSTPDFATQIRFGALLEQLRVVGRLVAYYFNVAGRFAWSNHDYVIQIPMDLLRRCPVVIGICSANVSPEAVVGALNTGMLTHLIARESTVITALDHREALERPNAAQPRIML
jgi:DNA-binding transcriptional regulator LsrR (DeoR family)